MSDTILKAETAASAEPWLLPEMKSKHLVAAAAKQRAGGFKKTRVQVASPTISRAMTASKLSELEQQSRAKGEQEGREQGYQQGYAEGQEKAKQLVNECQQQIDQLIEGITTDVEREKDALQSVLSRLVIDISRAVCLKELQFESNIEEVIRRGLAALPLGEQKITIYLNPADYAQLSSSKDSANNNWVLQARDDIAAGGCKVQSEHSTIDFTLQKRLEQIVDDVFTDKSPEQDS